MQVQVAILVLLSGNNHCTAVQYRSHPTLARTHYLSLINFDQAKGAVSTHIVFINCNTLPATISLSAQETEDDIVYDPYDYNLYNDNVAVSYLEDDRLGNAVQSML